MTAYAAPGGRRWRARLWNPHAGRPLAAQPVRRLLEDGSFREAAGRLGDEIAAMPSPAEVADRLHATYD